MGRLNKTYVDMKGENPQISVDLLGRMHLVWEDSCRQLGDECTVDHGGTPPDIFYRMWDRSGWSTVRGLATRVADGYSSSPRLAVDAANSLHVIWMEPAGLDTVLFERTLDLNMLATAADVDNNESWMGALSDYSTLGAGVISQVEALDLAGDTDGALHLVYENLNSVSGGTDQQVYYRRYVGSWSDATLLSPATPGDLQGAGPASLQPRVAASGQGVAHVVWREEGDLVYRAVLDGTVLSDTVTVVGISAAPESPAIAVTNSGDVAHIVWSVFGGGSDKDIWYHTVTASASPSAVSAATSGSAERVWADDASAETTSDAVAIALDAAGNVYVAWYEDGAYFGASASDPQTVLAIRASGQLSFGSAWTMSRGEDPVTGGLSVGAEIAIDSVNNVHVVWGDLSKLEDAEATAMGVWYFAFRP